MWGYRKPGRPDFDKMHLADMWFDFPLQMCDTIEESGRLREK